ncbi:MAG: phenylalanine--tRNA ligase subunit alpha, partial [Chitinivibrionales bacterium]
NRIRAGIQEEFEKKRDQSTSEGKEDKGFDPTLPAWPFENGSIHPLVQIRNRITEIFSGIGFSVSEGPEVETPYYNFDALNFPPHHPARDMQDTFFVSGDRLLRTHTSPVQIRVMEEAPPPIKTIMPGRVYRNEEISARSYCLFHQVEGLYIDKGVSLADLKGVLLYFARKFFDESTEIKIRPSFFPFTEPSIEVDIRCFLCRGKGCSVCKKTGWLEVLGAGMVHPNVLESGDIDPEEYSGYAFGMGIDRIGLLKYGIKDIRLFFENDIRFLSQF